MDAHSDLDLIAGNDIVGIGLWDLAARDMYALKGGTQ
jgi:hypothetical protein